MRVFVLLCLLGAAAADKPSPTYKASPDAANSAPSVASNAATVNAKTVYAQPKAQEKSDTVHPASGPNHAHQQPQAAAKSDTGYPAQQQNVVQPAPTQGYYYYYYPVTSGQNSHQQPYSGGQPQAYSRDGSGGHHGGGGHAHGGAPHGGGHGHAAPHHPAPAGGYAQPQGYGGGAIAGPGNGQSNLITPLIVIGGIFLALLLFGGLAAGGGGFGKRSFSDIGDSIGETLSNLDLGISVIDAVEMARTVLDAVNGVETQYERRK